jgi:hypothetical protein
MNNMRFVALALVLIVACGAIFLLLLARSSRSGSNSAHLIVTDATMWRVHLNGIAVATIREHVVADIERRLNRQWWLGMRTAISEFGTFVRLVAVSIAAGLAIELVVIVLAIQGDPHGAGHTLHAVFSASEATLQSGWRVFWQIGALFAVIYFAVALWAGVRRRARDFVVEAWCDDVRRAAQVAADGNVSLLLTQEDVQLWRGPHQIAVSRVRQH